MWGRALQTLPHDKWRRWLLTLLLGMARRGGMARGLGDNPSEIKTKQKAPQRAPTCPQGLPRAAQLPGGLMRPCMASYRGSQSHRDRQGCTRCPKAGSPDRAGWYAAF